MMSSSSLELVRTTTGIICVRSSARILRKTSSPPTFGRFKSRRMRAGRGTASPLPGKRYARASAPSRITTTSLRILLFLKALSVAPRRLDCPLPARLIGLSCAFLPVQVQGEVEGRARFDGALGPGTAAVAFHDLSHAGQAGTSAGELAGCMQPLERLEQLARIGGIEADAVVAHVT